MRFSTMLLAAPAAVAAMQSAGGPVPVVGVSTYYQTSTITITSCLPTVTDCPAKSTIVTVTSIPVITTTTAYVKPTTTPYVAVPASSNAIKLETCIPSTVTVTLYATPSTNVPAASVPASSAPYVAVPATVVPAASKPYSTGALIPKNTTVPFLQANSGSTFQVSSAALIVVGGVVALFL